MCSSLQQRQVEPAQQNLCSPIPNTVHVMCLLKTLSWKISGICTLCETRSSVPAAPADLGVPGRPTGKWKLQCPALMDVELLALPGSAGCKVLSGMGLNYSTRKLKICDWKWPENVGSIGAPNLAEHKLIHGPVGPCPMFRSCQAANLYEDARSIAIIVPIHSLSAATAPGEGKQCQPSTCGCFPLGPEKVVLFPGFLIYIIFVGL